MGIKEKIRKIINATPQNRAGGVFSPKRLMAAVAAVIMAVAGGVTAWAALDPGSESHNCPVCGHYFYSLSTWDAFKADMYSDYYQIPEFDDLKVDTSRYYGNANTTTYDYFPEDADIGLCILGENPICFPCLLGKIETYKASQNDPDPAEGSVTLHASVSGAYTLVIPATVELSKPSGGDGIGTYTGTIPVKIKGTLASGKTITVSVSNASMTCEDGTNAAVNFTDIPKTEWSSSEVSGEGTTANYTVSTELNVPGEWNGTATFGCVVGNS